MATKRKTARRKPASKKPSGQRKMTVTMSDLKALGITTADLRAVGALGATKRRTATKSCKLIRTKNGVRKGCYTSSGKFRFVKM